MSPLLLSLTFRAAAQDAETTEAGESTSAVPPTAAEKAPVRIAEHRRMRALGRKRKGRMRPWGLLQVFTTLWDQDEDVTADPASYGDPEADPGFQIARARFGFDGHLPVKSKRGGEIDYALSMGISTPYDALQIGDSGVAMVDAYGRYTVRPDLGPTSISLGLLKVPFSREALISSKDLLFQERAVGPENLTSVRDVGALASQAVLLGKGEDAAQIVLRAGVFNGNGSFLGDRDPGLMYAGRVEFAKGDTYRSWDPDGKTAAGVAASVLIDDALGTRTFAWNTDGLVRLGPWSLMGELGRATLTPVDVTIVEPAVFEATTRTSWLVATSVFVAIDGAQGVEIGGRVSSFDDNQRLDDNGDVLIVHGGAIWRDALPFFDVGAGYIHREEMGGSDISNDTIRIWTQIRPSGR